MKSIVTNIFLKLQVLRHIEREVVDGPVHLQKPVHNTGGYTPISTDTIYDTNKYLGRLLQISMQYLGTDLGLPKYPFSYDHKKYNKVTTTTWMERLWKFCYDQNSILKSNITYFPDQR